MKLEAFNQLSVDDAAQVVAVWADVPWWVDSVVSGRPYADVASLRRTAGRLAWRWSGEDLHRAVDAHPRIGERPDGAGAHDLAARREQAGAAGADAATRDAIRAGNEAYEQRFGRVFLIRAAGRTGPEILAELDRRLGLGVDTEEAEAAEQLREIALLRLDAELDVVGAER